MNEDEHSCSFISTYWSYENWNKVIFFYKDLYSMKAVFAKWLVSVANLTPVITDFFFLVRF